MDRDTPILHCEGLSLRRGKRPVLHVPSLLVKPGEVVAITGPNGAGKSTLMQICGLLLTPATGSVWLGGEKATRWNAVRLRRKTAMVFQSPLLFSRSVLDNVASGPRFQGRSAHEATDRAIQWLERFGVGGLAERNARELSGGEAQRVNLARAFAVDPMLLLMDEPFAGLDAPTRSRLLPELAAQIRVSGVTTLFITHQPAEARALATRLVVMQGGMIIQDGPVHDVFASPRTAEVAAILECEDSLQDAAPSLRRSSFHVN